MPPRIRRGRGGNDARDAYLQELALTFPHEGAAKLLARARREKHNFKIGNDLGRGLIKAIRAGTDILTANLDDLVGSTFADVSLTPTGRRRGATTPQLQAVFRRVDQRITGQYYARTTNLRYRGFVTADWEAFINGQLIRWGTIRAGVRGSVSIQQGWLSPSAREDLVYDAIEAQIMARLRANGDIDSLVTSPDVEINVFNYNFDDVHFEAVGETDNKVGGNR